MQLITAYALTDVAHASLLPSTLMTTSLRAIGFASLTALAACGGGGGDNSPTAPTAEAPVVPIAPVVPVVPTPPILPAPATDPKVVAGFWSGGVNLEAIGSKDKWTEFAIYLPEGQAWTVQQKTTGTGATAITTTTLARGAISVVDNAVSVNGPSYTFGNPLVIGNYRLDARFSAKSNMGTGGQFNKIVYLSFNYDAAFEVPAKLTDTAGRWNTSFSGGAVRVTLDISPAGALTGTSTVGCTYSGSVVPHPAGIAVFNLTLNESCPNSPVRSYSGITTVNAATSSLSAAFVAADGAVAGLLTGTR